eukprot:CAMPEP_0181031374 /NCGR_PEP_ID=MMETSP1070-20121207/6199_1 /TAXON_ID=265543 /ORGANISM="Minutocellus polymorphus, Strain NH13" /LENGTH=682 /DNA_ID=CAMNT_0023108749 /DNA_START=15 /DNA_END=2064 /DNA_ORIENTATION=-
MGPSPRRAGLQEQMRRHFNSEGPWQEAREGEFEMMDVSVTVLGLNGITSEAVKTKKHRRSNTGGGSSSHGHGSSGGGPPRTRSGSRTTIGASSSSCEYSESDIPVTAVASFFKNVTSNKTSIGTHLPSLALGMPTSSFGNTSRYMASWPSPASASSRPTMVAGGNGGTGNASFKFSRVMKRHAVDGSWDGEDDIAEGACGGSGVFTHETMDILVGLARDPVGVATLVITGEEMGEVQVNLPVKTGSNALAGMMNAVNLKKKKKKKKGNKGKMFQALAKGAKNSKKGAFFKVAPGARYRLNDTAALRLVVKAQPRNGGYDVEGSVVSGLSCPTGSSEGSSSGSSSSESEDDYDDEYEEEQEETPLPVSRQNSGPSHVSGPSVPSRGSLGSQAGRPAGLPPMAGQTYNPRIPPMQNAVDQYHPGHPSTMLDPHMHQNYQPNMLPGSPRHHVKTHMMEQQMHQQQRRQQGLGLQLPYDAPPSHGGHPHFDIPPVASEASTEPGYGDEFEGIVGDQAKKTAERNNDPSSMPPIKMKGKARSNNSRDTAMTTPITSVDSSARFMSSPKQNACEPLTAIFSCGAMSNLCIDDDEDKPTKRRKKKPPVTNIFAQEGGNKTSRKNRRGGGKEGGGGRRSRHDEYDENTILSSESETVVSMGSETFQDMEATRMKLRAYAERMGLDPEQLV